MPWWILQLAGYMLGAAAIVIAIWGAVRLVRGWAYDWRHAKHLIAEVQAGPDPGFYGSMDLAEEQAYLVRADGIVYTDDHGTVQLKSWDPPHGLDGPGFDGATIFYNGHTLTCLRPGEDHPGSCPEEGDWPDGHNWPVPTPETMPDLPSADPARLGMETADLVDSALASAQEDPAGAGWTDQLLAELREPLGPGIRCEGCGALPHEQHREECPERDDDPEWFCLTYTGDPGEHRASHRRQLIAEVHERLADTGEIRLASLRADYAAELSAQDYDAAEFMSRKASEAAEIRLSVHGL